MILTHMNNILGIRINESANNASINFGNVVHKGHQANSKFNSGNLQSGDSNFSPLQFNNVNIANDPDLIDQPQAQI